MGCILLIIHNELCLISDPTTGQLQLFATIPGLSTSGFLCLRPVPNNVETGVQNVTYNNVYSAVSIDNFM